MKSYSELYPEDIKRMEDLATKNNLDFPVGIDVITLWLEYSDSYAAGWLGLPKDDEQLLRILKFQLEIEESKMFDFN